MCINMQHKHQPYYNYKEEDDNLFKELAKYVSITQKLASLLAVYDIKHVCSKMDCDNKEKDIYDCVDCIINFYSKPCKWEQDGICVNDKSEWCTDFVDDIICGECKLYER